MRNHPVTLKTCGVVSKLSEHSIGSKQLGESVRRKLGISDGMLNVLMAQVALNESCVGSTVGQVVAARVPELVGMDFKRVEAGRIRVLLDQGPDSAA
jgi:hypothetical protein